MFVTQLRNQSPALKKELKVRAFPLYGRHPTQDGSVAQLVERSTLNRMVLGSSPSRSTIFHEDQVIIGLG